MSREAPHFSVLAMAGMVRERSANPVPNSMRLLIIMNPLLNAIREKLRLVLHTIFSSAAEFGDI